MQAVAGKIRDIITYIDAVEVLNSKSIWKRFNRKAREFAEAHKLPMIAGSDAHIPQYIGACYTLVETKGTNQRPSEREIFSAIKAGKTVCSGNVVGLRGACLLVRIKRFVAKVKSV